MASARRRTDVDLIKQLADEPFRFNFFQAVRVLERAALQSGEQDSRSRMPIGEDYSPREEVVRLRTIASFAFPAGDIAAFNAAAELTEQPPEMTVTFLGLTGPAGVLPQHYTQLLIQRIRSKDYSLRDFLDLFHHRLISLFYRGWRKYRFFVGYERTMDRVERSHQAAIDAASSPADWRRHELLDARDQDLFTSCLYSLMGLGTAHVRGRQQVDDETFLFYGGHFAHAPRNALSLQAILQDYLQVPARIVQFVGQWLYLATDDQSCLPSGTRRDDCNNALGQNVVVGSRVWGVENKFRVRLGPLSYREFLRFSPRGDLLKRTAQLVRSYAGVEFDFDVQPVLRAEDVPLCRIGGPGAEPYLGWNTWVRSLPMPRDAEDAVFAHEGWPDS